MRRIDATGNFSAKPKYLQNGEENWTKNVDSWPRGLKRRFYGVILWCDHDRVT